jgi:spore germination cell wall hydrolase CwlJ-like protein
LNFGTQARAEWRVLLSAALIGSGIGLAVGATYMVGGMAQAATDHSRSERIAQAAAGGFSESVLRSEADGMTPGGLRQARAHDPLAGPAPDTTVKDALQGRPAAAGRAGSVLSQTRELDCLTQAVYFEARGETARGQAAVAQVVLNRVKHPAFPKTVCGVVFQGAARHGCQFSFACDGSMHRVREAGAWTRARKIAARAMSGVVLADVGKATHFHTTGVAPAWGPRMLRVSQVGMHVFYRLNPHAARTLDAAPQHAVFVNLPAQAMAPTAPLRIATAMVEKTLDATLATSAPHVTVPSPAPVTAKPVVAEAPTANIGKASDVAAQARSASEPAA